MKGCCGFEGKAAKDVSFLQAASWVGGSFLCAQLVVSPGVLLVLLRKGLSSLGGKADELSQGVVVGGGGHMEISESVGELRWWLHRFGMEKMCVYVCLCISLFLTSFY